jgi:hypothetical protein
MNCHRMASRVYLVAVRFPTALTGGARNPSITGQKPTLIGVDHARITTTASDRLGKHHHPLELLSQEELRRHSCFSSHSELSKCELPTLGRASWAAQLV